MPPETQPRGLILASGSRYRQILLQRLTPRFECVSSDIDESRHDGEAPVELAARLAEGKARAVSPRHPNAVVIGSDQVAALGDAVLGKPGAPERAVMQLKQQSGRAVRFFTAVHVRCEATGFEASHVDTTTVHFRDLSEAEIEAYVQAESPLDCAGSFKSEGLGVILMDRIENGDPTALIGLPLIWLAGALRDAGIPLLSEAD